MDISVEPSRRDTYPAIMLAASYLYSIKKVNPEEAVVICPVDPYVDENYFQCLKEISDKVEEGVSNLVLMGIAPTYPSQKYGYIIPQSMEKYSKVSMFKEKPTVEIAQEYISQGALWNGGVFACKLKYLIDILNGNVWFWYGICRGNRM